MPESEARLDSSFQAWGQAVDLAQLQVHFHIPCQEEIDFALDLLETLIEPEFALLKGKLSKDERRRSLIILQSLVVGSFHLLPSIESEALPDPSPVPLTSQSQSRYSLYYQHLHSHLHSHPFAKNLRLRLLHEIGTLLGRLLSNDRSAGTKICHLDSLVADQSDDILSLKTALAVS